MPVAYTESNRKRAFGTYTGCLCEIHERINFKFTEGRKNYLAEYNEAEKLMQQNCDHYVCKNHTIHSNDNPRIKMPLGQWRDLTCTHQVDAGTCRLSLKDTSTSNFIPEELQVYFDSNPEKYDAPRPNKIPKPKKVIQKLSRYDLLKKGVNPSE